VVTMSCNQFKNQLHPWLRRELSGDEAAAVEQHVADCYACASAVENESAILDSLKARYDVPKTSPGFEKRVITAATRQSLVAGNKPWLSVPMVGGAVAAALALGIALGLGLQTETPLERVEAVAGSDTIAAQGPYTVRLAFDSAEAMDNVTLTVELPAHVEMSSYPGHQRLSWKVNLDKGENIVKLPLNVLFPGEGELVAHLDNGERKKTFRTPLLQIDIQSLPEPVL